MKILMLNPDTFPPDIRIEREARSLIEAGHAVFLLCPRQRGQPEQENVGGMDVRYIALPDIKFEKVIDLALYRAGISSAINPGWIEIMDSVVREEQISAIHIHNLPLVETAVTVAQRHDIPVVSDLHELYPENIKVSYPWLQGHLICWTGRWYEREKRCFRDSSRVIVISDAAKEYYIKKYNVSPDKVVVIGGMIDLEEFYGFRIYPDITNQFKDLYTIVYAGGYAHYRGLDTLVKAFAQVLKEIPNAHLLLVGPHPIEALRRGVEPRIFDHITITGYVDYSLFRSYIGAGKVAVHPLKITNRQMEYACPNKIFQYMACGLPIVASRSISFKQYIADSGAGVLFRSGDHIDLARAITALYRDPGLAASYAHNALAAVNQYYNWKNESEKLLDIYRTLG
jgi:glycosyltransferase involved in cell wall biosynthesis